jgi:uncharacterized protein YrrD
MVEQQWYLEVADMCPVVDTVAQIILYESKTAVFFIFLEQGGVFRRREDLLITCHNNQSLISDSGILKYIHDLS